MERTKKGKSAKNRIVTAAWQLFHEKGYNGTTMETIIALSGTSKGSFYYYFNTKDELLNTLSVILDDFYEELESRMNPDLNSFVKLLNVNYEAHKMIEENISIDLIASLYPARITGTAKSPGSQTHILQIYHPHYYRRSDARTDPK